MSDPAKLLKRYRRIQKMLGVGSEGEYTIVCDGSTKIDIAPFVAINILNQLLILVGNKLKDLGYEIKQ